MGCNCSREKYTTYITGPIIFNGNFELEIEFIIIMCKLQNFLIHNNLVYSYDIYHKNENGLIVNINNLKESLFITKLGNAPPGEGSVSLVLFTRKVQ